MKDALRKAKLDSERVVILDALKHSNGLVRPAADHLGIAESTLRDAIRDRHPDLAKEAKALRKANGYRGRGRPVEKQDVRPRADRLDRLGLWSMGNR